MKNFKKNGCFFEIKNIVKEDVQKSIYSAVMNRDIDGLYSELKSEVMIIKILKECKNELYFLLSFNHPNIPKVLMVLDEGSYVIIIQEKINGLNLLDYIDKHINIPTNTRIMFAYNLARVLKYIHTNSKLKIIHGDISPSNIIISEDENLYLIDFGSSFTNKIIKKEKFYYGTPGYFSPKIYENPMDLDFSIDIYSFGMILKLLEIDKIGIEGYELYKNCIKIESYNKYSMDKIIDDLLYLIN